MMAADASFTASTSQRYRPPLVSEPKIRRQFVAIPKQQQALLDRDDAWSGSLGSGSHAFANVPAEVLESVKAAHARQHAAEAQAASSSPAPQHSSPPARQVSVPLPSGEGRSQEAQSHLPLPSGSAVSQQSGEDSDSGSAIQVEWSSSPPRQPLLDTVTEQPSDKETDTQTTPSKRGTSPPPLRSRERARFLAEFPSSAIDDGDLELEEPMPLVQQSNPVRRPAPPTANMPEPTPPSAQLPVIPCSFNQDSSPEKPKWKGRTGLMKPLKFAKTKPYDIGGSDVTRLRMDTPNGKRATSTSPVSIKLPSKIVYNREAAVAVASAASMVNPPRFESSAKIPETSPVHWRQSSSPKLEIPADPPVQVITEETSLEVPSEIQSQALVKDAVEDSIPGSLPSPEPSTPWDVYKRAYPDFDATISDFVRACLCVQDLQTKKALAAFLYDDFIRAFSKDYLAYIGSLDLEDTSQPLTAIQWYNENVETPIFNKAVVNRQNLESILTTYADEVESAALLLPTSDVAHRQPEALLDHMTQNVDELAIGSYSPELSLPSPKVANVTEDAEDDSSMHEPHDIVDTSTYSVSKDPVREGKKPVVHRKISYDEMAPPPPTLARSTPQAKLSSRRPTASPSGSIRSRKRRLDESPEQRSKRWRALLQRRKEGSIGPPSSMASSRRF